MVVPVNLYMYEMISVLIGALVLVFLNSVSSKVG